MDKSLRIQATEDCQPGSWLGRYSRFYKDIDLRDDGEEPKETKTAPVELTIDIIVSHNNPSRALKIKSQLNHPMMKELVGFLRANNDVFTWTHLDMYGITFAIASHALNIDPNHVSVKQKRHGMDSERDDALKEDVD